MSTKTISVHHMSEAYYEKELRLIATERRAYNRAQKGNGSWASWRSASKRLVAHENQHNTD